jgi:hypothetical protein
MATVKIEIERPEGYEDVCDEIVLEDFRNNPTDPAWNVRLLPCGLDETGMSR